MYTLFVLRNEVAFGENLKMAEDIAKILDHPLAQVQKGGEGPHDARWTILNGFYALSWECGMPHLTFEDIFSCTMQKIDLSKKPTCLYPQGTSRPVHVLIVDDELGYLLTSAYALAGIPNVTVDFYHCKLKALSHEMSEQALFYKVCEEIEAEARDIVLMDQGIGHITICGDRLVKKLKNDGSNLIFVANTRGVGVSLELAGCLSNFHKGSKPKGVLQALKMYC